MCPQHAVCSVAGVLTQFENQYAHYVVHGQQYCRRLLGGQAAETSSAGCAKNGAEGMIVITHVICVPV
jgi:hypothetical protein